MMPYVLAHFIGDFLLQTEWMAINKKKSDFACTVHVFAYMIPFFFTDLSAIQLALIFVQHYLQDRTTFVAWYCKTVGSFQSELGKEFLPWGHFVVDQVFHFVWIWLVVTFCV
jgi:hypothetical protein